MLPEHITHSFVVLIAERLHEYHGIDIDFDDEQMLRQAVCDWLTDVVGVNQITAHRFTEGNQALLDDVHVRQMALLLHLDQDLLDVLRLPTSNEVLRHVIESSLQEAQTTDDQDRSYVLELLDQVKASDQREQLERAALVVLGQCERHVVTEQDQEAQRAEQLLTIFHELPIAAQQRVVGVARAEQQRTYAMSMQDHAALSAWHDDYLNASARNILHILLASPAGELDSAQIIEWAGLDGIDQLMEIMDGYSTSFHMMATEHQMQTHVAPVALTGTHNKLPIFRINPRYLPCLRDIAGMSNEAISPDHPLKDT